MGACFSSEIFPSTVEEEKLGAELKSLPEKDKKLLGKSNYSVFEVSTSASPLLSALLPNTPSVALKEMEHASFDFWSAKEWNAMMQRLRREWTAQLTMQHDNVVRLYAIGSTAKYK